MEDLNDKYMSMSTVLSGRSGFSCDFKKTEDFFAKEPKLVGVRHASAFSRGMRGGGGRAVGFNQPDSQIRMFRTGGIPALPSKWLGPSQ